MEDNQIEEIKQRIDIVDLINEYVPLKKRGSNYIGLCPFHNEKTPSFTVNPTKNFYHCFGCGKGGNVYNFLMDIENIDFKEALEILAGRAGVELQRKTFTYEDKKEISFKERLMEINELAKNYYKETLYKPSSKKAQEYIRERKLTNDSLNTFEIGYSDGNVYEFLKRKGYTDKEIESSGICYKRDDGKFIDRFWGRVIFPIKDIRGNVLAFGGRNIEKDSKYAKYINTSDTPIYNKGHHLFGMDIARKYSRDQIILVEGYMDVISLHQAGIKNAVAPLGTALTDMQANLVKSRAKEVLTCYDSDEAGTEANLRGIDVLHNKKIEARVINLGDAKDPDEYINKYGLISFKQKIDEAVTGIMFKIDVLKRRINIDTPQGKIEFLTELAKIIADIPNKLEQEVYIDEASKKYHISKEAISLEVNKAIRIKLDNIEKEKKQNEFRNNFQKEKDRIKENKNVDINENNEIEDTVDPKNILQKYAAQNIKREELIIYILLNYKELVEDMFKENILKYILNEDNKKCIKYILEEYKKDPEIDIQKLIADAKDEKILKNLTKIGMTDIENFKAKEVFLDILNTFKNQVLNFKKENIINRINTLTDKISVETKEDEIKKLKAEKEKYLNELTKIITEITNSKKR